MIVLNFPNPVERAKDFYGREKELDSIERMLLSGRRVPVIIQGDRRLGKTSLQNIAIQRLKTTTGQKIVPLTVGSRGIATLDAFVEAIFSRLASVTGTDIHQSGLVDSSGCLHMEVVNQFGEAFMHLAGAAQRTLYIICVDEFDQMLRHAGRDVLRFDALMHYLIRESGLPVAVLLCMTRIPDELMRSASSPFISEAEILRLQPFSDAELTQMVADLFRSVLSGPPPDFAWLQKMSGGHPYFAKLLLANLQELLGGFDSGLLIQRSHLDLAVMRAVEDIRAENELENIYQFWFTEMEKWVVLLLAARHHEMSYQELNEYGRNFLTAARSLAQRGYLQEQSGNYSFRIGFLGYWLRQWNQFEEEMDRLRVPRRNDPWSMNRTILIGDDDLRRFGL